MDRARVMPIVAMPPQPRGMVRVPARRGNRGTKWQAAAAPARYRRPRNQRLPHGNVSNMIGIWSSGARTYLLVLASLTTIFFALPIMLMPLRWAKLMLWRLPEDKDLAVYFGRCLGAFVVVMEVLMIRAGLTGTGLMQIFTAMMLLWLLMIAIHAVGALEGAQPITETLEIGFWLLLVVLTAVFWPAGAPAA